SARRSPPRRPPPAPRPLAAVGRPPLRAGRARSTARHARRTTRTCRSPAPPPVCGRRCARAGTRRGRGREGSDAESDGVLLAVRAHVDDDREVDAHRAVLGLDVVPAAGRQRLEQRVELFRGDAQRQRATEDPDRDLLHLWSSAGWTISVSTPPELLGCTNATRELRMPVRGVSSMRLTPA